jgi:hypothetical protein
MIALYEITFRPKRGEEDYIHSVTAQFLSELLDHGYILGEGRSVYYAPDKKRVVVRAYFTGRDAWRVAQKDHRGLIQMHWKSIKESSTRPPSVIELKRPWGSPVPSCKCKRGAKPALDLWCTPESQCPPLLCSKGGVVEFYKLPIDPETLRMARLWERVVRQMAGLAFDVFEHPHRDWAKQQLYDHSSWITGEAKRLATVLSVELGREVRAFCPPVHIFRL